MMYLFSVRGSQYSANAVRLYIVKRMRHKKCLKELRLCGLSVSRRRVWVRAFWTHIFPSTLMQALPALTHNVQLSHVLMSSNAPVPCSVIGRVGRGHSDGDVITRSRRGQHCSRAMPAPSTVTAKFKIGARSVASSLYVEIPVQDC